LLIRSNGCLIHQIFTTSTSALLVGRVQMWKAGPQIP
jgi:hypothetical protein